MLNGKREKWGFDALIGFRGPAVITREMMSLASQPAPQCDTWLQAISPERRKNTEEDKKARKEKRKNGKDLQAEQSEV